MSCKSSNTRLDQKTKDLVSKERTEKIRRNLKSNSGQNLKIKRLHKANLVSSSPLKLKTSNSKMMKSKSAESISEAPFESTKKSSTATNKRKVPHKAEKAYDINSSAKSQKNHKLSPSSSRSKRIEDCECTKQRVKDKDDPRTSRASGNYNCKTQDSCHTSSSKSPTVTKSVSGTSAKRYTPSPGNDILLSQESPRKPSQKLFHAKRCLSATEKVAQDSLKKPARHLVEKDYKLQSHNDESSPSSSLPKRTPKRGKKLSLEAAPYKHVSPSIKKHSEIPYGSSTKLNQSQTEFSYSDKKVPPSYNLKREEESPAALVSAIKKDSRIISDLLEANANLCSSSECLMEVDSEWTEEKLGFESHDAVMALVVDTNILMSHISLLDAIKMKKFGGMKLVIVIPYAAIQELDNLKQSNPKAQKAIRWCNGHLEQGSSHIQGQSFEDYLEAAALYGGTTGDDKMRDCCLFYKKKGFNVSLLTNDVNLRNKAILSQIQVTNSDNLRDANDSNSSDLKKSERIELNNSLNSSTKCAKRPPLQQEANPSDELGSIKDSLRQTLTPIVEQAMDDAYGDLWETIVVYKPPWSALDTLRCIERHWIAVFMDKLSDVINDCVKDLLQLFSSESSNCDFLEKLKKRVSSLYKMLERTKYKKCIKHLESPQRTSFVPSNSDSKVESEESHFEDIMLTLGRNATDIFTALQNEVLSSGLGDSLWTSLTNLRDVLVSLGFSLVKLSNEPSLETLTLVNQELSNYWNCAKEPHKYQALSVRDLNFLMNGEGGRNFVQACTVEFEKIINEIVSLK